MPSLFANAPLVLEIGAGGQAQGGKAIEANDQSATTAGDTEFTTAMRNEQRQFQKSLRVLVQKCLDALALSFLPCNCEKHAPVLERDAPVRTSQIGGTSPARDRRGCHMMTAACVQFDCSREWSATPERVNDCPRGLHSVLDIRQSVSLFSTQKRIIGDKVPPDSMRLYQQGANMPTATADRSGRKINKNWFLSRMQERGLSMRRLSQELGLDASAMSLILSGQRGATPTEVKELSERLLVPATEVMRNLGIDVQDDIRKVPIVGHLGGDCTISMFAAGTEEYIVGPADLPSDAIVIQCRTVGSQLYQFDGWLVYLSAHRADPTEKIGRLCIVAEATSGKMYLAQVERGYKNGLYNLVFSLGGTSRMMENVSLSWASAVVWIKPRS